MLYTIALGGNALLQRGEPLEAELLRKNSLQAAKVIAELAQQHQVVIVHGNGPQVGLLALQSAAYTQVAPYPFDILGAESQGMIGYVLQQGIYNHAPEKTITTLLTQVIVDAKDPAFNNPNKFIGPVYSTEEAEQIKIQHPTWTVKADGRYFRRVVPSPLPQQIHELSAIKHLLQVGAIVIAGGGGGIPCIKSANGQLRGVEAVIDKDMTGSLLAQQLQADRFVILTDVDAVYENFGTEQQRQLTEISIAKTQYEQFPAGSMQPKIRAACQFVERTKQTAVIGNLKQLHEIIAGKAGTKIIA